MEVNATGTMPAGQQRPQHRRNASSKTNILRALVSPNKGPATTLNISSSGAKPSQSPKKIPLAPSDNGSTIRSRPLGERQSNVQSPPSSPSKQSNHRQNRSITTSQTSHDIRPGHQQSTSNDGKAMPKKTKSSTNLGAMFSRMNRSSKDLSRLSQKSKDKENTTPPSTADGNPSAPPIWAQFASNAKDDQTRGQIYEKSIGEIPRGRRSVDHPHTAVKMPQSLNGENTNKTDPTFHDDIPQVNKKPNIYRNTSGGSVEEPSGKEKLNIAKRGGRVMAAVAAWQNKGKEDELPKEEPVLDPGKIDEDFEAVLESRNIPEPMRQKMRSLTLGVKADFVKQNQAGTAPPNIATAGISTTKVAGADTTKVSATESQEIAKEETTSKRSRPRSRTFTFSKNDRNAGDQSPSKKQRSQSKGRPTSIFIPKDANSQGSQTPSPSKATSSPGRKPRSPTIPADFIAYLQKIRDPCLVEVGRVHKLRILLRNETVAWVDTFISLGGMNEVVSLLHRIMGVEWREEHEDQLLHETLLCLKGLCTTERAMIELEKVADQLFPALLGMLYDDEKKGPAEYSTRTIITAVLFNYLQSSTNSSPQSLEAKAYQILRYMGEPTKSHDTRPVDFVLDMHIPRPYKLWSREMTNVTREVFWIFLHHLNVVSLPKSCNEPESLTTSLSDTPSVERLKVLEATYTRRHFPGTRPPVPAAPYIGGVEWDATVYLTSHLDLLNGLLASLSTRTARNTLRGELRDSGIEKTFGATLRTCKEKFYSGVHDGLRVWVAAATEDGWDTRFVREGPTREEQAASARSPRKNGASPAKKEKPPQLEAPKLDIPRLDLGIISTPGGSKDQGNDDDDGWLG